MVNVLFVSSGEQFDYGLADLLHENSNKVVLLRFAKTGRVTVNKSDGLICIEVPSRYAIYAYPLIQRLSQRLGSQYVIVPRKASQNLLINLFLRKLVFRKRKYPIYVLWYSPTPAYIFKAPQLLRACNKVLDMLGILVKAVLSVGFNLVIFLLYDYVLTRDFPTYKMSRYVNRKTFYMPPVMPRIRPSERGIMESPTEPYILAVITVNRKGPASNWELRYVKLAITLAKLLPKTKFLIVGTSYDDIEDIIKDVPENISLLGRMYGENYYRLVANASAILAYIELPGTSNRIAESMAFGKPLITSKYALTYHPGLKHLYNCLIIDLESETKTTEIREWLKALINDKSLFLRMSSNIKALNSTYYKIAYNVVKQIFNTEVRKSNKVMK